MIPVVLNVSPLAVLVYYTVSEKGPTFKLSVTLSNLNRFSIFLNEMQKRMKFTNPFNIIQLTIGMLLHYLGEWKIHFADVQQMWKKMQTNCIFIPSNFVIHPQILIFSVFNIASISPYWLQIKFSWHCSFTCLLLRSICGTGNLSQQTSRHCSVCQQSTWHSATRTRFW